MRYRSQDPGMDSFGTLATLPGPAMHHRNARLLTTSQRPITPGFPPLVRGRRGFTLIELLVVILVMGVLLGMAIPAYLIISNSAAKAGTQQLIANLTMGVELYRSEALNRFAFPTMATGASTTDRYLYRQNSPLLSPTPTALQALDHLERTSVFTPAGGFIEDGQLVDVWGNPIRYYVGHLAGVATDRPNPATPAGGITDWNWDTTNNRVRAWGTNRSGSGTAAGPQPFPYIWSLGKTGSTTNWSAWIYQKDSY